MKVVFTMSKKESEKILESGLLEAMVKLIKKKLKKTVVLELVRKH